MRTLSVSYVKANWYDLVKEVEAGESFAVTVRGRPVAILKRLSDHEDTVGASHDSPS